MRLPVFRTGKHTDSRGNERNWTREDLLKIVENYTSRQDDAPVVVGHPKTNSPAYGWVEKLELVGDTLYATFKDLTEEFTDWLKKKFYKYRSIAIGRSMDLVHVGFLGAAPPAIKGLGGTEFSVEPVGLDLAYLYNEEGEEVTFAEIGNGFVNTVQRILRSIRDMTIADKGIETANQYLPPWDIDSLEYYKTAPKPESSFTDPENQSTESPDTGSSMTEAEIAAMKAENERLTREHAAAQTEAQNLKLARAKEAVQNRVARFKAFCESDKLKGKVIPAIRPMLYALYEHAVAGDTDEAKPVTIAFSQVDDEGNAVTKSQKVDELFQAFAESLPVTASGERLATPATADKDRQDYSESKKAADVITASFEIK